MGQRLSICLMLAVSVAAVTLSETRTINRLGYELLRENRNDPAIVVFEISTEAFPESWNVWDSLGEAYAAAGRREEAIRAYERALQLNPQASSSSRALAQLRPPKR